MMQLRKPPRTSPVDHSRVDLPWSELTEMMSASDVAADLPFEWVLDRARACARSDPGSNDGARR